ncbi:MAG: DUF3108 domain-containing protein [bacterium]|nr:DUF3108 domain-containing protein [bacterium]
MKKYFIYILIFIFFTGCVCEKGKEKIKFEYPEVTLPPEEKIKEVTIEDKEEEIKEKTEEIKEETKKEEILTKEEKIISEEKIKLEENKKEDINLDKKEEIALLPKKEIPKKEKKEEKISPPRVFFEDFIGEILIYDLKWNMVNLGKAIIACLEEKDKYRFVGITIPFGIPQQLGYGYNRVDAFIDKKTGKTNYFYTYSRTGNKEEISEMFFNWPGRQYTYISRKYKNKDLISTKRETIKFEDEIFDCLTLFYFLRNGDYDILKNSQLPIALSEKWYLKVNFKGKEIKKLPNGEKKEVFILEPLARKEKETFKKGIFDIWITNDKERKPVYFEGRVFAGKVIMTLLETRKTIFNLDESVNKILEEIVSTL